MLEPMVPVIDLDLNGYTIIPNFLLRARQGLTLMERAVVLSIWSHNGSKSKDHAESFVKHETIASEIGKSISSVKRAIKGLKTKDILVTRKSGYGRCNAYNFNETIVERYVECLSKKTIRNEPSNDSNVVPQTAHIWTDVIRNNNNNKQNTNNSKVSYETNSLNFHLKEGGSIASYFRYHHLGTTKGKSDHPFKSD